MGKMFSELSKEELVDLKKKIMSKPSKKKTVSKKKPARKKSGRRKPRMVRVKVNKEVMKEENTNGQATENRE